MAFFETTNIGALFFFHLAGIKNVFGINNSRLLAYQFKYAGKDFPKNVPGANSISIDAWKQENFNSNLESFNESFNEFEQLHHEMDNLFIENMNNKCESSNQIKMFKWLRNKRKEEEPSTQEQQPTIRSLYSKIKAIFINNDELFDFPLGDSKPDNLYYVGGFHFENEYFKQMAALFGRKILYMPNDITKIIIEKRSKVSVERTIVLISLDNCEKIFDNCSFARNEKLWEVFLNAFVQILQIENNLNFIYDCSLDKIDKVKLEDTLNKYDNYNLNININKIQNINEEMAKGTTRMLITNCSGYQVIEAIAYNVEIYCIPRYPDQFYVAEALKLQYFKTRVNIEERPYTQEVFNSIKNIPLSLDRTDVVIYRMILSPVEYIREMFNRKYSIVVNKIFKELREKWSKKTPKEIIFEKVMEFVPIE